VPARRIVTPKTLLAIVLIAGALVRFGRIGAGLPNVFLPDEELNLTNALSLLARRTLEPLRYDYPTFEIYLLAAINAALFAAGRIAGAYASATDFGVKFFVDATLVYLAGRAASALFGVSAIAAAWAIGRRLYGERAGLFAAVFLALGIESAREAGVATPNSALTFLSAVAFLLIVRAAERGGPRDYLLAGAAIGLSISAKYNAAGLMIPLVAAHAMACGRRPFSSLALAAAVALLAFLAVTPYWVLGFREYLSGYLLAASHMRTGHIGHMGKTPILWAVREILSQERIAGLLAFAGAAIALARRTRGDVLLLAFLVPSFLAITSLGHQQLDYVAFLWPPAAVLAGRALDALLHALLRARSLARPAQVAAAVAALAIAPSALGAVQEFRRATRTDTREVAREWIEANLPANAAIAIGRYHDLPRLLDLERARRSKLGSRHVGGDYYGAVEAALGPRPSYRLVPILVSADRAVVPESLASADSMSAVRARIAGNRYLNDQFSTRERSLDELLSEGAGFVLLSSQTTDRYLVEPPPPSASALRLLWLREREFFSGLLADERLEVIHRWDPDRGLTGPRITLYRIAAR